MLDKATIEQLFSEFAKSNANPKIELHYTNAFTLLVAVVLSARAMDKVVNQCTPSLFAVYDTPSKMLELGIEGLIPFINRIGLFRSKARYIINSSAILIEKYNSVVPNNLEDLITLPGVFRKSANVILNTIYQSPVVAVDTHVFRVSRRIGLTNAKTVRKVEDDLMKLIPKKYLINAHHWLVLHGRYVCKAQSPQCYQCIVSHLCKRQM
ncbi:endonuclease III [Candidatus Sarmatiella mevalonica]|uniref:endonuclease III n=1 Tax=Candidatus Sarmatiella mevalonica TaxID=2770581 RepID=UPI001921F0C8|nr:endonuclease III [Candidatus Sarmatiella mevalonica]